MFELEFIELLNNFKELPNGYEKVRVESSIFNMIKQNPKEYKSFLEKTYLDNNMKNILDYFEKKIQEEKEKEKFTSSSDVDSIRNHYLKWLENYRSNNNQINQTCEEIVQNLINTYFKNRFTIIQKVLEVNQDEEYEAFKWHIKNQLRAYFAKEIENYILSEDFENLSFIKKHIKKNRINYILGEVTKYNFNKEKFEEIIN